MDEKNVRIQLFRDSLSTGNCDAHLVREILVQVSDRMNECVDDDRADRVSQRSKCSFSRSINSST